jgi:16S rRNA (cytidine1402-2'-O)-methyltransferase
MPAARCARRRRWVGAAECIKGNGRHECPEYSEETGLNQGEAAQATVAGSVRITPALYVVATPIGNLGDISVRALEVLRGVAVIAAEDTRVTRRLLDRYGIATPLIAAHEHNEREAARRIIERLEAAEAVALVSDAGTPGIADPGALVVAAVRAAGYPVLPLPGPCAAAAAMSVSGLAGGRFLFCGFLPARGGERRAELAALAGETAALVFYEAPHRILECVEDLRAVLGDERGLLIARELTKLHETTYRCRLGEAGPWLEADDNRRRGEFVLVIDGAPPSPAAEDGAAERMLRVLLEELPLKQAVAIAVRLGGAPRNVLYPLALRIRESGEG